MLRRALVVLALALAIPAAADPKPDAASRESAERSFRDFAKGFMAQARAHEQSERMRPRVAAGPGSPVVTYRGYGDEYRMELRATGSAAAPYVGLLHYTERVYSCRDASGSACTLASTEPVTEVFRFRSGRWAY